jgi:hypothetical protein
MENLQLQSWPQQPRKSNKNSPFFPFKQLRMQTLFVRWEDITDDLAGGGRDCACWLRWR